MRAYAILPVKLRNSKTRLSEVLSETERRSLVEYMLQDVMDALGGMDGVVIVGPKEIDDILNGYEYDLIVEEDVGGLNKAVGVGNNRAIEAGADATLFVPGDTPLMLETHVNEILRLGKRHPLIISPSRRGGTGILFRRPPGIINERFTESSFSDFQKEAKKSGVELFVYDSFALSLDIDTPDDVSEFMLHGSGTRTYDFLLKLKKRF